jgi:hypothetical protein
VQEALTLVRLKPGQRRGDGGGALTICGDQLGDVALIEAVVQLYGRFALGLGAQGADPSWSDGSRPFQRALP